MKKIKTDRRFLWFALLLGTVWSVLLIALLFQAKIVLANQTRWSIVTSYVFLAVMVALLLFCFIRFFLGMRRQYKINEFRKNMLHNMVHELKTPLSTIDLASQFLQDKSVVKDEATMDSYLRMISDEAKSIRDFVDQLLTVFSSANPTDNNKTDVFINKLLKTVAKIHQLSLSECHGVINFDLQAENDIVFGNLPHLSKAFSNLIDNAIKYRDGDLVLTISTRNVGNSIRIAFADNGLGIEESNLQLIFEPFIRINTDNEHYVKGYGLGLDYVNNVVKHHKGTITVDSKLHQGSTFVVTLPLKN
jgi:two-component system phosphate regulon sensor histidine kinase PhoR